MRPPRRLDVVGMEIALQAGVDDIRGKQQRFLAQCRKAGRSLARRRVHEDDLVSRVEKGTGDGLGDLLAGNFFYRFALIVDVL